MESEAPSIAFERGLSCISSTFSSDSSAHTSSPALVATQYTQRHHLSASQSPLLHTTAQAGTERNWEENYWEDDLHLCTAAAAAALQKYICNFPLKILDWSQTCNFGSTSCTFFTMMMMMMHQKLFTVVHDLCNEIAQPLKPASLCRCSYPFTAR